MAPSPRAPQPPPNFPSLPPNPPLDVSPEATLQFFLQRSTLPEVDDADVAETMDKLKADGAISDGRWALLYTRRLTGGEGDGAGGGGGLEGVCRDIEGISNMILAAAAPILKRRGREITAKTKHITYSVDEDGEVADGHGVATLLEDTTTLPSQQVHRLSNPDNAVNWVFTGSDTQLDAICDQVLSDAVDLLDADPTRLSRYAVSVSDTAMRFWYLSPSIILPTHSFDFVLDPTPLVEFLMTTSFASHAELGYDPAMKRVLTEDGMIAYEVSIEDENGEVCRYRTVGEPFYVCSSS
ncbi:hypothetical protein EIP91_007964 [Steccherinum ochraceum]|uniref:Fungal-type protein kinase domain-containing protein n=1 Tax=Steccherinum ochraceum TaxID=92696 RepID=A0A4R0R3M9_9APHY|nr:hypothetical protein EIP91_007964 [Steccherinum ochraceum]